MKKLLIASTVALSWVSWVTGSQAADIDHPEVETLVNASRVSANDGFVCAIRVNMESFQGVTYPNDRTVCFDQDLRQLAPVFHMRQMQRVAVGDKGRIWGLQNRNIVVDFNAAKQTFASVPAQLEFRGEVVDLGEITNLIITSLPVAHEYDFGGALFKTTDTPMALTSSGLVVYYKPPASGSSMQGSWQWALGDEENPVVAMASYWKNGRVYPHFMFLEGPSSPEPFWTQMDLVAGSIGPGYHFANTGAPGEYPSENTPPPTFSLDGRFPFGGRSLMARFGATNAVNWWEHFRRPDAYTHRDWRVVKCPDFECGREVTVPLPPGGCPTNGLVGLPVDHCTHRTVYEPLSLFKAFAGEHWGGEIVGSSHGIRQGGSIYGGNRPHGFYSNSSGRIYVIYHKPPEVDPAPLVPQKSLRVWDPDQQLDPQNTSAPDVVDVDEYGDPVYSAFSGWSEIPSHPVPTYRLPVMGDAIELDVFVPAGGGWAGTVALNAAVPAAGIWNTYLGQVDLGNVPRGQWHTISMAVPAYLREALNADFPGAEIRTFVNTNLAFVKLREIRTATPAATASKVAHGAQHADVRSNAFLSFENASDWAGQGMESGASIVSDGQLSLGTTTDGWIEVSSRLFSTDELPEVGAALAMDVFLPDPRPAPYWLGDLSTFLSCPSLGVWRQYVGRADFTNLFPGEWNTIEIQLSAQTRAALSTSASDCSLAIDINVGSTGQLGTFYLDRVGFAH